MAMLEPQNFGKVAVFGDLHGDFEGLIGLLGFVDLHNDLVVFLGDYADRGESGVEIIRKVEELQSEYPDNVAALMGNHEDYSADGKPHFSPSTLVKEAEMKTGSWRRFFKNEFKPFIDDLTLAAVLPGNALFVHGGVSSQLHTVHDLNSPSAELRRDLLWSDPFEGVGERPNLRGAGVEFGSDVSAAVCYSLGVGRIIRSHQPQLAAAGPFVSHGGRVVTVQATSVYGGKPFVYFLDPRSMHKDNYRII